MTIHLRFSLLVLIAILATGCGISRQVAEINENAETAFDMENYREALSYYEEIIELKKRRNREISGKTYYMAGVSAWELQQTNKAIEYLVQAEREDFTSETSFHILALAYREIDNLSLEITYLENYVDSYPEGENIDEMRKRLFETYIESNNYDLAMELWHDLDELSAKDPELLEKYFILNRRMENENMLKEIADKLYRLDKNNTIALEYLGEYYFWKAENSYQDEMTAYENNKTRRQYRQLLEALDTINEHFKLSRDYFERLLEIDPDPRYYEYLRNIYIRFGNEKKAEYYKRQSELN